MIIEIYGNLFYIAEEPDELDSKMFLTLTENLQANEFISIFIQSFYINLLKFLDMFFCAQ